MHVDLAEAVEGRLVLLALGIKRIGLHFRLDNINGVRGKPHGVTSTGTEEAEFPAGDVLALNVLDLDLAINESLEGKEVGTHTVTLTDERGGNASEDSAHTGAIVHLADRINWAVERFDLASLGLQTDSNVFNRRREETVGNTSRSTSNVELAMSEPRVFKPSGFIARNERALHELVNTKLDGYTSADTHQRGQGALVKTGKPLIFQQFFDHIKSTIIGALGRTLKPHLSGVKGLTTENLG